MKINRNKYKFELRLFGPNWNKNSLNIFCACIYVARTNVPWTNVAWTDVAWTNVAWTNFAF